MVFVRSIKGKLKLNPALKFWVGLLLLLFVGLGGFLIWIVEGPEAKAECEASGGVWIGGFLRSSYCEQGQKPGSDW